MVPGVVRRGVEELDVSARRVPASRRASRHCRPNRSVVGVADPVEALRRRALARDVEGLRRVSLHAEGQFERRDPGVELAVDHAVALVEFVEPAERVELDALTIQVAGRDRRGWRSGA